MGKPRMIDDVLQVVAEVPPGSAVSVLSKSAEGGLFAREFVESGGKSQHAKVPLPLGHDRAAALRISATLGSTARGVVPTRKGWAIQVLEERFQEVAQEVNPEGASQWKGSEYEVSGLPLSWSADNVTAFLSGWGAKPVGRPVRIGFRHTWTVRAEAPPPSDEIRNPDSLGLNVLALVKPKTHKAKKPKQVLQWSGKPLTSKTATPKSWSSVVQTAPKPAAAAGATSQQPVRAPLGRQAAEMSVGAAPAVPADFMTQLQNMIMVAMKPLYEEIAAIKEAVDLDAEDQAEVDAEGGSEDEGDEQEEKQGCKRTGEVPEPLGQPPRKTRPGFA